jgi:hypothetical protein
MGDTIDRVNEKSKNAKDESVGNAKNLGDKPNDAATGSPSSFSSGQEKKYGENGSNAELRKIEAPLTDYNKEEPVTLANIKENEPVAAAATNTPAAPAGADAYGGMNKSYQQYSFNENNEFFNPFMMGLKLWQNYSTMWMDYYNQMLNYAARMAKDFENTKEKSKSNGTDLKGFKVKVE